jgi:diguanylate cyclase
MESLRVLSEAIIRVLKEFSLSKSYLSVESLMVALADDKDVCALLRERPRAAEAGSSGTVGLHTERAGDRRDLPQTPLDQVLGAFDSILSIIEPTMQEETQSQYSDLKRRLHECQTLEDLALESSNIVSTVNSAVCRTGEQTLVANEFLIKLSQNLSSLEEQLFSYQSHNQETYILHDQFCNNLLSQTQDIKHVVTISKAIEDARDLISSRIETIGNALAAKRREDEARLVEADSKITALQTSVRDYNAEIDKITQRAEELEKEVLLDPLLKINNRRAYDLKIVECVRNSCLHGQIFSVILIDVDHFKEVNDRFGHRAGDKCLRELTRLVGRRIRKTDFLARYGGEELVIIITDCDAENAGKIAEKIRESIDRTRFYYHEELIRLTISLGVTQAQPTDKDAENLFVRVDKAMYRAKREGRNKVIVG